MNDILSFFPTDHGWEPRQEQRDLLLELQRQWHVADVFVVTAPTALGKTEIAVTLGRWSAAQEQQCTYVVPNNILVDQAQERYPDLVALHRQDYYQCKDFGRSCKKTIEKVGKPCFGCEYACAKKDMKSAGTRLCNSYIYWAHRLASHTVIFDEAHTLVDMLADTKDIRLWQRLYKFPDSFKTVADVIEWAQGYLTKHDDVRLREALREIVRVRKAATIEYRYERYRGETNKVLHVVPTLAAGAPPWLWPYNKVRKIVMLSATIGEQDIRDLGLHTRRVKYLECASPIPATNRPIKYERVCNMGYQYVDRALPVLAKRIRQILDEQPGKGLIHLPYKLAHELADLVGSSRLMIHERHNKAEVLERFRNSPPEQGRVLVASGLYEGVDLPYDAARWQVIGKVPYLSLASEPVKARAAEDPQWYAWQTIKQIIQASGRIVRAADDYGISYIFDSNFERLYQTDLRRDRPMFPKFIRDAIQFRTR